MRIFFIQKAWGLFASSGEYRANLSFLRHFASLGHATTQLCFGMDGDVKRCIKDMEATGRADDSATDNLDLITDSGDQLTIEVSAFTNVDGIHILALDGDKFKEAFPPKLYAQEIKDFIEKGTLSKKLRTFVDYIESQIKAFQPTHVVFNDPLSLKATSVMPLGQGVRRVFVIHCAEQLPFGPYAGGLDEGACSSTEHELLREVDGIWSVSQAMTNYAREHGQLNSTFFPHDPWTYLDDKTHQVPEGYHNWDREIVGMINPSLVKGVTVLLNLAERFPNVKFAVWLSWAFDEVVRAQLEAIPNIELRPTSRNMQEDVWKEIKVLLVPSLWYEAWGMVVVEAQLCGIPVLSSDSGGLPESKLGVSYILPVKQLTGEHDKNGRYVVDDQDIQPWVETLQTLLDNKDEYESVSKKARSTTAEWLRGMDGSALENWLESMQKK